MVSLSQTCVSNNLPFQVDQIEQFYILTLKAYFQVRYNFWQLKTRYQMTKNNFFFHLKSSFRSHNIYTFVWNFWTGRKIKLISKFMASQLGKQIIAIHIFPSSSRSKGNQTIKFGQLIEYNMTNIFSWKIIFERWYRNYSQILF